VMRVTFLRDCLRFPGGKSDLSHLKRDFPGVSLSAEEANRSGE
jgi:hypothetical protein